MAIDVYTRHVWCAIMAIDVYTRHVWCAIMAIDVYTRHVWCAIMAIDVYTRHRFLESLGSRLGGPGQRALQAMNEFTLFVDFCLKNPFIQDLCL